MAEHGGRQEWAGQLKTGLRRQVPCRPTADDFHRFPLGVPAPRSDHKGAGERRSCNLERILMKVAPRSAPNVSAVGQKIAQLQTMQSQATRKLVADLLREPPAVEASTIVSLTAESVKLSTQR